MAPVPFFSQQLLPPEMYKKVPMLIPINSLGTIPKINVQDNKLSKVSVYSIGRLSTHRKTISANARIALSVGRHIGSSHIGRRKYRYSTDRTYSTHDPESSRLHEFLKLRLIYIHWSHRACEGLEHEKGTSLR